VSNAVFVDLKDRELSCYAVERNGRGGTLGEIFTCPVADGHSFSLEKSFDKSAESYLSLPLSLLDFRVLELPFTDIRKIRELLPFEIDSLVLGGSGSVVFDAHIISRSDGKSQVLVSYLPKEVLRAILGRLKASGIDPKAVISVELASIVSASASAEELAKRLLSPEPLADKARTEGVFREISHPTINLRTGEFAYTVDQERTRKSLRMTAVLVLLLLAVFTGDSVMGIVAATRENSSLKSAMRKTYQGLFPTEKKISNELYQLKAHIQELKDKEESFVGVSPLGVLLSLSKVSIPGIVFNEVGVDGDNIVLKGEGPSMSDVQKAKTALGDVFSEVNISDTKPSSQNKTLFTITAKGKKT
jgi:type II secretory pathway component PulL